MSDEGLAGHQPGRAGCASRSTASAPRARCSARVTPRTAPVVAFCAQTVATPPVALGEAVDDIAETRSGVPCQQRRRDTADVMGSRRVERGFSGEHVSEQLAQRHGGVAQLAVDEVDGLDDLPGAQRDLVRRPWRRARGSSSAVASSVRPANAARVSTNSSAESLTLIGRFLTPGHGGVHVAAPSSRGLRGRTVAEFSGRGVHQAPCRRWS